MRITLVDYGAGNLPSVERAFARLGAETGRAGTPDEVTAACALVLPGVGHFAAMARTLTERGWWAPLRDALARGVPFLGICLGMHALYESSDEAPGLPGLGLLKGAVSALPATVRLPHMGWNQVRQVRPNVLFRGVSADAWFYFAHSFAVSAQEADGAAVALCQHGAEFVAAMERSRACAVQFHPEKSGSAGRQVLQNFLELAAR